MPWSGVLVKTFASLSTSSLDIARKGELSGGHGGSVVGCFWDPDLSEVELFRILSFKNRHSQVCPSKHPGGFWCLKNIVTSCYIVQGQCCFSGWKAPSVGHTIRRSLRRCRTCAAARLSEAIGVATFQDLYRIQFHPNCDLTSKWRFPKMGVQRNRQIRTD